jgi:4a-hydroxytetrahydrobiopterin dehydratase
LRHVPGIQTSKGTGNLMQAPQGWEVVDNHHLIKIYKFPDFAQALAFVNRVGAIAEAANHHPDIELSWGKVVVKTYTHTSNGLSRKDYALATAIDS